MEAENYRTQVDETVSGKIPEWAQFRGYDEREIELAKRLARECLISDFNWTKQLKLKYCISILGKIRMGKSTFTNYLMSYLFDFDAYVFPTQENEDDSTFDHTFIRTFLSYMQTKDEEEFKIIIDIILNSYMKTKDEEEFKIIIDICTLEQSIRKNKIPKSIPLLIWNNYSPIKENIIEEILFKFYQHNCIMNNSVFIQSSISYQKTVWGPWIYYIRGPLTRSKIFLIIQYLLFNHQTTISKCGCIFNISAFNI